jgi:hypothetical protein
MQVGKQTQLWFDEDRSMASWAAVMFFICGNEICELRQGVPRFGPSCVSNTEWLAFYEDSQRLLGGLAAMGEANAFDPTDPVLLRFLVSVYIPALLFHGVAPSRLLQSAIDGDIKALCSLVRIDKWVLCDSRVGRCVASVLAGEREGVKGELIRSFKSGPSGSSKPDATKALLAAAIIGFSEIQSKADPGRWQVLTPARCRKLFDAIEFDATGRASDRHLTHKSDDAWRAAVRAAERKAEAFIAAAFNGAVPQIDPRKLAR